MAIKIDETNYRELVKYGRKVEFVDEEIVSVSANATGDEGKLSFMKKFWPFKKSESAQSPRKTITRVGQVMGCYSFDKYETAKVDINYKIGPRRQEAIMSKGGIPVRDITRVF